MGEVGLEEVVRRDSGSSDISTMSERLIISVLPQRK